MQCFHETEDNLFLCQYSHGCEFNHWIPSVWGLLSMTRFPPPKPLTLQHPNTIGTGSDRPS